MAADATPMRGALRIRERLVLGRERREILERHNWYRNLAGGWTHPHCMDFMSRREVLRLSPAQLDYKLCHGSLAALPEGLLTGTRKRRPEK